MRTFLAHGVDRQRPPVQDSLVANSLVLGVLVLRTVLAPVPAHGLDARIGKDAAGLWLEFVGTPGARVQVLTSPGLGVGGWVALDQRYLFGGTTRLPVAAADQARFFRGVEDAQDIKPMADPTNLVWCRAGSFLMGSVEDETRTNRNWQMVSECPQTLVTLTQGFWIGKFEVTQQEYFDVLAENPSYFTNAANHMELPSDRLTWNQASNYCAKLALRERVAGRLPAGYTYRLPTEAEWEYACRAGTTTRFYFGEYPNYWYDPTNTPLGQHSWYFKNSKKTVWPPGQKLPNPWGLYDLYGNICEWVIDRAAPYPGGHVTNYVATSPTNINGVYFTNSAPASWAVMAMYRSGNWNDTDLRGQGSPARIAGWKTTFWQNLGLRVVLGPVIPGVWTYRGD